MTVERAVAVCATPRVGGNYLCGLLRAENVGDPGELFHPERAARLCSDWGVTAGGYLAELWARRTVDGTFSVLFHWEHRDASFSIADWPDAFPRRVPVAWVLLERRDRDAQARSFLTAYLTGAWGDRGVPYLGGLDERDVDVVRRRFDRQNADWALWLHRSGIQYRRLFYEDAAADPVGAVAAVRAELVAASRRVRRSA